MPIGKPGDPTRPASLLDITKALYLGRIHASASMMLLYYDHILTLHREVKLLWHTPSVTNVLMLFLRYFTLLGYIPMSVALYDLRWSDETCDRYLYFNMVFLILTNICCTLLLSIRIHVLYNKNRWVSAFIFASFIVVNILSVMAWSSGHRHNKITPAPIEVGCVLRVQGHYTVNPLFKAWVARASFDICVVVLTIARTWYLQGFGFELKFPLARLLTRDGAVYFIIVFASEAANFVFHTFAVTINQLISRTLIVCALSRLVFNLREEILMTEMTMTDLETHMDAVLHGVTGFAAAKNTQIEATTGVCTTFTIEEERGDRRRRQNDPEIAIEGDSRNGLGRAAYQDPVDDSSSSPVSPGGTTKNPVGRRFNLYDTYV